MTLTEEGQASREMLAKLATAGLRSRRLYDPATSRLAPPLLHVQALRAHALFQRDVDYIVQDGKVVIIDEFTGRTMPGRRWSEGLHQAMEAKEGVAIQNENQTLASITFQNYFRLYDKLAGMTGTADDRGLRVRQIYKLDVVVIPTNMPMVRDDINDLVYRTEREKFDAIVEEIATARARAAGAGRHRLHRDLRGPVAAAQEGRASSTTC